MNRENGGAPAAPLKILKRLRDRLRALPWLHAVAEHEASRLLVAGVLVGALGGGAAGAFDHAMVAVGRMVLGTAEPATTAPVWWRTLLGPPGCGLLAGAIILWGTLRKRPQSVPDVLERAQLDRPSLTLRDGMASAVAAALVIGGGQSGGREGPIVQIASTLAAEVCRRLRLSPRHLRALVAAGAAAGVAASFNTPVGGAFFALEIILGDFGVDSFAPVVAATVTGTVVGQALLGDRIALHLPTFTLNSPLELAIYLVLGGVAGGVAVLFKRAILWGSARAQALGLPLPVRAAAAGLLVAIPAVLGMHEVMGNGYAWMEHAITHADAVGIGFLLLLLLVKIAATMVTVGGRGGAGIFAPSLFLGAVTGLLVGRIAADVAPGTVLSAGAYGMVGMGAVASGVLHAPITMTLMLFEMTGDYQVMLPLLVSLAAAGIVSRWLGAESIYVGELRHRGIALKRPAPSTLLQGLKVADVVRESTPAVVPADEPLRSVVRRMVASPDIPIVVTDAEGRFFGLIDLHAATAQLFRDEGATAVDAVGQDLPSLRNDDALAAAVPLFFHGHSDALPVIDDEEHLVGVLYERDVIAAYHRALQRSDTLLARFEGGASGERTTDFVELPEGYAVEVVEVDGRMVGRTLQDLALPSRGGCLVLAHNVWDPAEGRWHRSPADAHRLLREGDRLVMLGPVVALGALSQTA